MNIQDLYIEKFRSEIKETYIVVYDFFDQYDGEVSWEPEYKDIRKAFSVAAVELNDHVRHGRFVSEDSRNKVLSDLSKGVELMIEANPESETTNRILSMIGMIEDMELDDS